MSQPSAKKGRGCLFYGCLTLILIMLLAVVGIYFGIRSMANSFVEQYTETEPTQLAQVEISDSELNSLTNRVSTFMAAVEGGESAEPLRLNSKEVNALIAHHESFKDIKDKLLVDIEEDRVLGQISIPAEVIPILGLFADVEGRYLNGKSEFTLSLKDGELVVHLQSLAVGGNELPESVMSGLQQQNLAKDFAQNPRGAEMLNQFESIEVKDGEIIVTAKENSSSEPEAEPASESSQSP